MAICSGSSVSTAAARSTVAEIVSGAGYVADVAGVAVVGDVVGAALVDDAIVDDGVVAAVDSDVAAGTVALTRLWERHRARTLNSGADKITHWSSEVQMPRYLDAVTRAGETI